MTVHERFAAWVAFRGWSQHDAAREIGCSQALVSEIIRGRKGVAGVQIAHAIELLSADWAGGPIRTEEWLPREHDESVPRHPSAGEVAS